MVLVVQDFVKRGRAIREIDIQQPVTVGILEEDPGRFVAARDPVRTAGLVPHGGIGGIESRGLRIRNWNGSGGTGEVQQAIAVQVAHGKMSGRTSDQPFLDAEKLIAPPTDVFQNKQAAL